MTVTSATSSHIGPETKTGAVAARAVTGADPAASSPVDSTKIAADTVTLSSTARRLSEARQNLAARDRALAPGDATEWLRLQGEATVTNERRPAADLHIIALEQADPEHAVTARQARAFNIDSANGGHRYRNPFAGSDRISLTAIVADEAGLYAPDEREAAARAMNAQQRAWQIPRLIAGAGMAYFEEAERQYGQLSSLERNGYPQDYVAHCRAAIELERTEPKVDLFWWLDGSGENQDLRPQDILGESRARNSRSP